MKNLHKILIIFFLLCFSLSGLGSTLSAFAETRNYTDVLTDLQKDSEFDISDYPDDSKDYSIQVIQIAEGENGELFLYTYQPCQKTTRLLATDINMSLSETVDGTKLYKLELLSCNGTLCKYLVKDVKVSADAVRYYNITTIYREFIKGIDLDIPTVTPVVNSVDFKVGRLFIASTDSNGNINYYYKGIDVIQIINPYFGNIRYLKGFKLYESSCDAHYIAFSTDKQIDKLISADVFFKTQSVSSNYPHGDSYGSKISHMVSLNYTETVISEKNGLLGKTYTWNRIEKVSDFIKNEDIDLSIVNKIKNNEWVLRFYESDYTVTSGFGSSFHYYTMVSEVSILRLEFETNGVLYNLGAVCPKISGTGKPSNNTKPTNKFVSFFEKVLQCIQNFFNGSRDKLDIATFVVVAVVVIVILFVVVRIIFAIINSITK